MSTDLDFKYAVRAACALGLLAAVHATSGCSDEAITSNPYENAGGMFGFNAGGTIGFAGSQAAGGFPSVGNGGLGSAGLGSGGFGNGGLGSAGTGTGGGNPDGSVGMGGATGDAAPDAPGCTMPAQPVIPDPGLLFAPCSVPSLTACIDGHCVPSALVPAASQSLVADCVGGDAGSMKCVPDFFIQYNNQMVPPTCTSLIGAEGRCLSLCIPQIDAQKALLPKENCKDGELCAPCFDPRTGVDTGACTQGCDTGPAEPKKVFDKCCGGSGSCVPTDVVPAADRSLLGTDTCTATGQLCAPDKLSDLTYEPPDCVSLAGLEGRCMPSCIPAVAAQASRLPQATCPAGELCAPCYDPLTGDPTGACTRGTDQPVNPPTEFPLCCGGIGHCVPSSILTTDQQGQLVKETCTGAADLCAPDIFAIAGQAAETCRAMGALNAEGRCIPECVGSVQSQRDRLERATCPANFLCAPCWDPVTGADTGACSQNGDTPKEAKKLFPECCGTNGSCVPVALIPDDQEAQLEQGTCTGTGVLCAPKSFAAPGFRPATCNSVANAEGRCISTCVPMVASQATLLPKATCGTDELCAPCTDPRNSQLTGACSLNGDAPTRPPVIFDQECCDTTGLCVPREAVPPQYTSLLPAETCTGGWVCAPKLKLNDVSAPFQQCIVQILGFEVPVGDPNRIGACIPKCIADSQISGNPLLALGLAPSNCPTDWRCAPCVNPLGGTRTGACD